MIDRVLLIDHTAALAGGEVAMARLLTAVDRSRFEPMVLLMAEGPLVPRLREEGVRVAVLPVSGELTGAGRAEAVSSPVTIIRNALHTLAIVPRLASAIRGAKADLVVANTLKSAVLTAFAAPLAGRRWVWHLHDRIAPDYLPRVLVLTMRMLARFGPRAIVANSVATRETVPGTPDRRIAVAYPGVDIPSLRTPTRSDIVPPTFGLVGRIAPTKGQVEFLHAAALLEDRLADARFRIIGDALFNDGEFAAEVRRLPDALGISERVVFTGWVSDPSGELAGLTALVHASPVPEPFGQVVVEAMLAGVPVIGTDAGGMREILDADHPIESPADGVTRTRLGLLVKPGDHRALAAAMCWMADHPTEREAMARDARASAIDRFDVRRSAEVTMDVWTRALGAPASGPGSLSLSHIEPSTRGNRETS
ncbi:glycosyltransferase [Planctomonas sp. JC2975]|uniref:glycosyltransferase n=1 Tax=Planctomonas sp. JC2975 TaxID=2729626 RepID=UPI0014741F3A|nr:glycosyltransferase [Planctomonas sp. JC2975]NNC11870.1 glycosyltransferase [Planctomonas sp. JC2975]